jgi:hypothetical protein
MSTYIIGKGKPLVTTITTGRLSYYNQDRYCQDNYYISENHQEFLINVFDQSFYIFKNTKEGGELEKMIAEEKGKYHVFKRIKKWLLRIIKVTDMENYIISIKNDAYEQGKTDKIDEFLKVLELK